MRSLVAFLLSASLFAAAPCLSSTDGKKDRKKKVAAEAAPRESGKGLNFYSPEREMALGRELALDAERSVRLIRDPVVVGYVTQIADRIARSSDAQMPIQVRVVDSDQVGAFALPGGYLFVNTGLLLEAQTEAELAGVMAHEIAHVSARHATKQRTRVHIWNIASVPLMLFGGPVVYAIQNGAVLAVPLTFLKFSRNFEREADRLGLQYHYAAGYDPMAFVTFFERVKGMEKGRTGSIAKAFSTHPMTQDRIVAAEQMIEQQLPSREEYVVNTSQHDEVQNYLRVLLRQTSAGGLALRKRVAEDKKGKPRPF